MDIVTEDISAQNTFTDGLYLRGDFSLSIAGTFSGTVTVQRSFDGSTWADVDTFTSVYEGNGYEGVGCQYRAGIKTGEYTSGTASVTIRENDHGK